MDIVILACKYFLHGSTCIWPAANPVRCSWTTSLTYSSFPISLILFHRYLAHCQLVVQHAISADTLLSALLAYGQPGLRRSHEKASFYILVTHTHLGTLTGKPPVKLHQCFFSSVFILKDCFDGLWNNWNVEKIISLYFTRRQWHFLQLLQMGL